MEAETTDALRMQLTPVGVVRSPITTPMLTAGESDLALNERMDRIKQYHRQVKETVCRLEIFPEWGELIDGIEGFPIPSCSTGPT